MKNIRSPRGGGGTFFTHTVHCSSTQFTSAEKTS